MGHGARRTRPPLAEFLPKFSCKMRSKRSQQQHQRAQQFMHHCHGYFPRRQVGIFSLNLVNQLHDGSDTRVEMPASVKVQRDLGDGLVELAQQLERESQGSPFCR